MFIGQPVTGGTATRVIFAAAGPVLSDSAFLTWDGTYFTANTVRLGNDADNTIYRGSGMKITCDDTNSIVVSGATGQKLGFYGTTAIAQRAAAAQDAVATTGATNVAPWGYTTEAQANAIVTLVNELRAAMVALGLIKGSA